MKQVILFFLFFLAALACRRPAEEPTRAVDIVKKYIRAVETMDYGTMDSLLAPGYVGYGPSYGDSVTRKTALENWKYNITHLYDSIRYTRSRQVAVTLTDGPDPGTWVSNWGEVHITYRDGNQVILWINSTYKIEKDRIVKSYTFYNEADALRQLGYVFCRPEDLKE